MIAITIAIVIAYISLYSCLPLTNTHTHAHTHHHTQMCFIHLNVIYEKRSAIIRTTRILLFIPLCRFYKWWCHTNKILICYNHYGPKSITEHNKLAFVLFLARSLVSIEICTHREWQREEKEEKNQREEPARPNTIWLLSKCRISIYLLFFVAFL